MNLHEARKAVLDILEGVGCMVDNNVVPVSLYIEPSITYPNRHHYVRRHHWTADFVSLTGFMSVTVVILVADDEGGKVTVSFNGLHNNNVVFSTVFLPGGLDVKNIITLANRTVAMEHEDLRARFAG